MGPGRLEYRIYRSLDELEAIRRGWEELLERYPLATTFSTPDWLISWWRAFGQSQELLVAGFFDSSTPLVGLAAFSISRVRVGKSIPLRRLRLMGDGSQDSDNLDLPVLPGCEEALAESILTFLRDNRGCWDFAEMRTMPEQSPAANALRQKLKEENWVAVDQSTPASAISLPATWEEYLRLLSAKERGKVGLRARRLEKKYEVRIRRCGEEAEIDPLLQALYELHRKHWRLKGSGGTLHMPARQQFYRELAHSLLKRRRLELWVLELQGKVVAAQFGFRHGSTAFSLQEGFDPDYAADSVGYVLRSQVIKQLIGEGVRRYDFLGGLDESKRRWGAESQEYLDLEFARPMTLGAAYLRTRIFAGEGKSWLRRSLPVPAWKVLHKINVGLRGTPKQVGDSADTHEKAANDAFEVSK